MLSYGLMENHIKLSPEQVFWMADTYKYYAKERGFSIYLQKDNPHYLSWLVDNNIVRVVDIYRRVS
jgi:hypothetical protein